MSRTSLPSLSQSTTPATALNPWMIMFVVGMGSFCSGLMGSSVNVMLPTIMVELGVSMSVVEWVVTGYMLGSASLIIFYGRLGDILGHKRIYTIGFVVFAISCLACGLAPTISFLIVARVVQSMGISMVVAVSPALATTAFPPEKRGQALGLYASAVYVGLSLGPTFGGSVSDWIGWPWVFFSLAGVGAICALLSLWLPTDSVKRTNEGIDVVGAVLFAVALSALLAGLSQGSSWGWASPLTLTMFALFSVLLVSFVRVERRVKSPMIDLTMFRNRAFSSGIASAIVNYMLGMVLVFLMPFYLVQFRGFAPQTAGLLMSVQALTMVAMAPLSGLMSDRLGSRSLAAGGLAIQGISLFMVSTLGADAPQWMILLTLAMMGLGVGLFTTPNNNEIMSSALPERRGVAASMGAAARTVGSVVGVSVGGAVFRGIQSVNLAAGATGTAAFLNGLSGAMYTSIFLTVVGIGIVVMRGPHASPHEQRG